LNYKWMGVLKSDTTLSLIIEACRYTILECMFVTHNFRYTMQCFDALVWWRDRDRVVSLFNTPIHLRYNWNIVESGVKHHKPINLTFSWFIYVFWFSLHFPLLFWEYFRTTKYQWFTRRRQNNYVHQNGTTRPDRRWNNYRLTTPVTHPSTRQTVEQLVLLE
jgi:hypothetical protein